MITNLKLFKKINILLTIILVLFMTSSCGSKQEKPMVTDDKDKIPEGLTSMADKGDTIIEDVEKIMEEMKKPEKKEQQQGNQQQQEGQGEQGGGQSSGGQQQGEQQGQQGGGSSEGGQSEQQKKPMSKEEKLQSMWESLGKSVEGIHTSWNEYEIKSLESGAKNEDIIKFEEALDSLTISVEEKKTIDTLHHANRMNYYMSVFFDPYKGNPDGEIMRLKYFARQSHIFGLLNDWEKSLESIALAENSINVLRPKINLDEKDKNLMEKLNLSLINMKSTIERNNVELLKIKRDLVLKNLEQLQEKSK